MPPKRKPTGKAGKAGKAGAAKGKGKRGKKGMPKTPEVPMGPQLPLLDLVNVPAGRPLPEEAAATAEVAEALQPSAAQAQAACLRTNPTPWVPAGPPPSLGDDATGAPGLPLPPLLFPRAAPALKPAARTGGGAHPLARADRPSVARCWRYLRAAYVAAEPGDPGAGYMSLKELYDDLEGRGEHFPGGFPYDETVWRPVAALLAKHYKTDASSVYVAHVAPAAADTMLHKLVQRGDYFDLEAQVTMHKSHANTPGSAGVDLPLALAAAANPANVAKAAHLPCLVQLVLQCGARVNAPARGSGNTALHYAASGGQLEAATLLLKAGADAAAENAYGETPLHFACRNGHLEAATLLLADPAVSVNGGSGAGHTALHFASAAGHGALVQFLVERGASTAARTRAEHATPLLRAAENKHHALVASLEKLASYKKPETTKGKKKKGAKKGGAKKRKK